MADPQWLQHQSRKTLGRIWPRVEAHYAEYAAGCPQDWQVFAGRVERHFERLFGLLFQLYGTQYDFFYHLEHCSSAWPSSGSSARRS